MGTSLWWGARGNDQVSEESNLCDNGSADVTDEGLMTAFTGAEALINSRPLTYQSANPSDGTPITPNHFLIGQVGGQFAPGSVESGQFSLKKGWRRVQELELHFWHRWLRERLPTLNRRSKWPREQKDVQVNDVVLVVAPDTRAWAVVAW